MMMMIVDTQIVLIMQFNTQDNKPVDLMYVITLKVCLKQLNTEISTATIKRP